MINYFKFLFVAASHTALKLSLPYANLGSHRLLTDYQQFYQLIHAILSNLRFRFFLIVFLWMNVDATVSLFHSSKFCCL